MDGDGVCGCWAWSPQLTMSRAQWLEDKTIEEAAEALGLAAVLAPEAPFTLDEQREVRAPVAEVRVRECCCACSTVRRSSSRGDGGSFNGLSRYPRSGSEYGLHVYCCREHLRGDCSMR